MIEEIHQEIDFFVLQQPAQSSVENERILETSARLQLGPPVPVVQRGHAVQSVSAHDHATLHLGDVYHINQVQESDGAKSLGSCLAHAPIVSADSFVGRAGELDQMSQALQPGESAIEQRRLVWGGIGGIGKT